MKRLDFKQMEVLQGGQTLSGCLPELVAVLLSGTGVIAAGVPTAGIGSFIAWVGFAASYSAYVTCLWK
jgi:hypothetical protein